MHQKVSFLVECEMSERWVPHFLGMLTQMQHLGNIGSSRTVGLYADGDGDFHPKFSWPSGLAVPAEGNVGESGDVYFDAG